MLSTKMYDDSYNTMRRAPKKVEVFAADYSSDDEEYDYEEDEFYNHYEPEDFDEDDDYQPFVPEDESREEKKSPFRVVKPLSWAKLSPPKTSPESKKSPVQTWWDKPREDKKIVNGVLDYSVLLPPKTDPPKREHSIPNDNKGGKNKKQRKTNVQKAKVEKTSTPIIQDEFQKPTRMCLSVIKNIKCFHKTQCRFAHDYADLKECNFGEKCKKIVVVNRHANGELELANKNKGQNGNEMCSFKHTNESKTSYLKRVPQNTARASPQGGHKTNKPTRK